MKGKVGPTGLNIRSKSMTPCSLKRSLRRSFAGACFPDGRRGLRSNAAHSQRLLRRLARAVQGHQPGFHCRTGRRRRAATTSRSTSRTVVHRKQARAVIDGLEADVVTMNQSPDIDIWSSAAGWSPPTGASASRTTRRPTPRLPSSWCARAIRRTSRIGTIWSKPGCQVIVPNPKTSGNGRYTYLAAWGYALGKTRQRGAGPRFREQAVRQRAGARRRRPRRDDDLHPARHRRCAGHLRKRGHADRQGIGQRQFDIVYPSLTIEADRAGGRRREGRRQARHARRWRRPIWSSCIRRTGQEIIAKHDFRPRDPAVLAQASRHSSRRSRRFTVEPRSAAGTRCRRCISPTAASYRPDRRREQLMAAAYDHRDGCCPGFG